MALHPPLWRGREGDRSNSKAYARTDIGLDKSPAGNMHSTATCGTEHTAAAFQGGEKPTNIEVQRPVFAKRHMDAAPGPCGIVTMTPKLEASSRSTARAESRSSNSPPKR